jgi:hypothetical protein
MEAIIRLARGTSPPARPSRGAPPSVPPANPQPPSPLRCARSPMPASVRCRRTSGDRDRRGETRAPSTRRSSTSPAPRALQKSASPLPYPHWRGRGQPIGKGCRSTTSRSESTCLRALVLLPLTGQRVDRSEAQWGGGRGPLRGGLGGRATVCGCCSPSSRALSAARRGAECGRPTPRRGASPPPHCAQRALSPKQETTCCSRPRRPAKPCPRGTPTKPRRPSTRATSCWRRPPS